MTKPKKGSKKPVKKSGRPVKKVTQKPVTRPVQRKVTQKPVTKKTKRPKKEIKPIRKEPDAYTKPFTVKPEDIGLNSNCRCDSSSYKTKKGVTRCTKCGKIRSRL